MSSAKVYICRRQSDEPRPEFMDEIQEVRQNYRYVMIRRETMRKAFATALLVQMWTILVAHLPYLVLEQIFKHLSSTELRSCMLVCRHWSHVLDSENSVAWQSLAQRKISTSALSGSHLLSGVNTYKMKLRALSFAWYPIGIDRNAYLRCLSHDDCDIVDEQYWGWNLANNRLLHGKNRLRVYPRGKNFSMYKQGERMRLVIDCDRHVVYFESTDGTHLGIAFARIPPVELYPTIWTGQRLADVSMVYIGRPH
ncbi:unnamed protein product [Angiostrongylus costaricensis]|uniref:F-box domain-containing protein n=1 Tax=Angiostrongylus costaricensis TaxID=334426 RepID=A0A0R3PY56_ANGCS|nr:unnamed protein product [Angiostrongylus costaricensis]